MRWTKGQDAILREFGYLGARKCAQMIRRKTGVTRTVYAVQRRASRIGVSLFEHETCPGCGRLVKRLRQTGFCDVCHERRASEPRLGMAQKMRAVEMNAEDAEKYQAAVRENWKARQRKRRD